MKILTFLVLALPALLFGKAGPDLSAGSNADYFTNLRMTYAANPKTSFFPAWSLDPEHEALARAYKNGELDRVIKLADSWLEKCPVDADTHLRVAMCLKEKGDFASYSYHLAIFYGLLNSITATGNGRTVETAFKVISTQEEYSLLQEIGAKLEKQSLVAGPCDKMEISRKNGGVKLTLYFNVAIPLQAMERQLKK